MMRFISSAAILLGLINVRRRVQIFLIVRPQLPKPTSLTRTRWRFVLG